ncbi:hypothetical protein [Psychrobacter frigidicola]|uniref:hypothetical protein n=1 Tax=Psychrobacter frigidicola TaxID=45611 RepID=UPI0019180083|nr:hypothetical protein [Psychrobacter frigidicola]
MIEWFRSLTLSDYGSLASFVGLSVSIITLLLVSTLKKRINFNIRVEEHRLDLIALSSDISSLLGSFQHNTAEIDDKFAIANVKFRELQKAAPSNLLKDIKVARKRIRSFRFRYRVGYEFYLPSEQLARLINTDINIVVEELVNIKKNIIVSG